MSDERRSEIAADERLTVPEVMGLVKFDPQGAAEAIVGMANRIERLTSQNAKMAAALAHYEGWFGTECPCDDDECALDGWAQ